MSRADDTDEDVTGTDEGAGDGKGPVAARPPLPVEEMGGDPACWLGLVEDHRDAAVTAPEHPGPGDVSG